MLYVTLLPKLMLLDGSCPSPGLLFALVNMTVCRKRFPQDIKVNHSESSLRLDLTVRCTHGLDETLLHPATDSANRQASVYIHNIRHKERPYAGRTREFLMNQTSIGRLAALVSIVITYRVSHTSAESRERSHT